MRMNINDILNEARVLRTIDPKIWASMSSMTSKNRSTLAADAKPMRRDTKEILLQKYVAGLLTMKANCPNSEADIDNIKAYKNFGHTYIDLGGTIQDIKKLYVENGGTLTDTDETPSETDYPSYDEVNTEEDEPILPSLIDDESKDEPIDEPVVKKHNFDQALTDKTQSKDITSNDKTEEKDFPSYDEVNIDEETIGEKYDNFENYFNTVGTKLRRAQKNQYLVWDEYKGLILSNNAENAIAQCVSTISNNIDKKPRFMCLNTDFVSINHTGNNGVYDDYYYKETHNIRNRGRLSIKAGSNYYYQEEVKGPFYTSILADNDNNAAITAKNLISFDTISGVSDEQLNEIMKVLKDKVYLPTLPELVNAISELKPGQYWTSSVDNNGKENIILSVDPDGIDKTSNPNQKANVVAFLSF